MEKHILYPIYKFLSDRCEYDKKKNMYVYDKYDIDDKKEISKFFKMVNNLNLKITMSINQRSTVYIYHLLRMIPFEFIIDNVKMIDVDTCKMDIMNYLFYIYKYLKSNHRQTLLDYTKDMTINPSSKEIEENMTEKNDSMIYLYQFSKLIEETGIKVRIQYFNL